LRGIFASVVNDYTPAQRMGYTLLEN